MAKNKKRGVFRKLLVVLVAFGPGTVIFLMAIGKCENKYQSLPIYGQMPEYEFTGADGKIINNKTQEGKITLFTTIQTSCPQNCAIDLFKFNLLVFQDYKKNQNKLGYIKIVSIVTDENGDPVNNIDELLYTLNDMIDGYDSTIWNIVTGDPKQIYDIENNDINLYTTTTDSSFAGKSYLETMLLVDKHNQLRLVRRGNKEGYIRDFKQNVSLLKMETEKDIKNESVIESASEQD